MQKTKSAVIVLIDILLVPFTLLVVIITRFIMNRGIHRMQLAEKIFMNFGILPIQDHYYQPMINPEKHLKYSLRNDRNLPGIDFNDTVQLDILEKFNYADELIMIPVNGRSGFYYDNDTFSSGDAEYLYSMIRHFKPKRIIEIGSGFSTLIGRIALEKNTRENSAYQCDHICIEPYENNWLEQTGATIMREKAENLSTDFFKSLGENDILFIDSSHIIRPQGEVLFEYLELLPVLNKGVLVHIHDIFSPKDYLNDWVLKEHKLWNEQYLLEAFLSLNKDYEIIGAVNYLSHNYQDSLYKKCPVLASQPDREPGSFWIRRCTESV